MGVGEMSRYTCQDYQTDNQVVAEIQRRPNRVPVMAQDDAGNQYPMDRFATIDEYNYFYGESTIAYYHRLLTGEITVQKCLERQLVYLNGFHQPRLVGRTTYRIDGSATRRWRCWRPSKAVIAHQRTDLQRQLNQVTALQAAQQQALAQLITCQQRTLAKLYSQRIDPADFPAIDERLPVGGRK